MISDLINNSINIATQPIRDGIDLLEGLNEGEIREVAALRLGADVVAGMAFSEVITVLEEVMKGGENG